jgi:hypothetical protein
MKNITVLTILENVPWPMRLWVSDIAVVPVNKWNELDFQRITEDKRESSLHES